MRNFLDEILVYKKEHIKKRKKILSIKKLKEETEKLYHSRSFKKAISAPKNRLHLIAEIKRASPSAGIICKHFDPLRLAEIYEDSRASAISVITCGKFFKGNLEYLKSVSKSVKIPVLCKDFIIDEYQIYEARVFGADAILLIACILEENQITDFINISKRLKMDCLVEVHSEQDLRKVLKTPAEIIGINNRNLKTFVTDLEVTETLIPLVPKNKIIVSESGIETRQDIQVLKKNRINAVLVGQGLLEADDIKKRIKYLGFGK